MGLLPKKIGNGGDDYDGDMARMRDLAGWLVVNTALTGEAPKVGKSTAIWQATRRATGINPDRVVKEWDDRAQHILNTWGGGG